MQYCNKKYHMKMIKNIINFKFVVIFEFIYTYNIYY